MSDDFSFRSMMESSDPGAMGRAVRRLKAGEVVEATVLAITGDTVFVDVQTPGDGRIARDELLAASGELRVKVGEKLRATVVNTDPAGPILAVSLGGERELDAEMARLAHETGTPVRGSVTGVNKGGLEVTIGPLRAFCPASQVELSRVAHLPDYVGQHLEFKVVELRDSGKNVVLSRRALLEDRRQELTLLARERLNVGQDVDAVVTSTNRHGAVVDIEGVEGFVHISELSRHRIERVEDAVNVGDRVQARILSFEDGKRGLSLKLSLRALEQVQHTKEATDEILEATVTRAANRGVFVQTARGEGLIPLRELGLAPGADHRRAYPVGRSLKVVSIGGSGKLAFSATRVARVEERSNYREFSSSGQGGPGSLGSFGDLFRERLGVPEALPEEPRPAPVSELPARTAAVPSSKPVQPRTVDGVVRRRR